MDTLEQATRGGSVGLDGNPGGGAGARSGKGRMVDPDRSGGALRLQPCFWVCMLGSISVAIIQKRTKRSSSWWHVLMQLFSDGLRGPRKVCRRRGEAAVPGARNALAARAPVFTSSLSS